MKLYIYVLKYRQNILLVFTQRFYFLLHYFLLLDSFRVEPETESWSKFLFLSEVKMRSSFDLTC